MEWVEFSPDSQRVLSASSDNTARIWDVRTGQPLGAAFRHARTVHKAVFSPDGRRVATASLDRTTRIWDALTGQVLTPPLPHDSPVCQVSFSADGRRLLTTSWGGTSRLWDTETGLPLSDWLSAGGRLSAVSFDPEGGRLIGRSQGGVVRILNVPPVPAPVPAWFLELAEAVAGTRLSTRGDIELVSRQNLDQATHGLELSSPGGFYERLGRWFVADPGQRPASPF